MADNIKKPKIRFKGFTEDWEKRKLGELLTQRVEHQKISKDAPLLAFSYAEGVIDPEDKKSNKRDFIMTDKYNKIFSRTEKDDIIYNPANVIHGAIHRNKLKTGVVSPIYKIFTCNEGVSSKYLGERLHTDSFIREITKYIEGTVIKLRTLSPEQFLEMTIEIPKAFEEQNQIGVLLDKLDTLITLHQQKCDKLKNIKKSMLQKMFPQEGKKVPELRFAGFTGDWEKRKLGEVAEFNPKSVLPNEFEYIDLESVVGTEIVAHRAESKETAPSRAQRLAEVGDVFYQTVRPYQRNNCLFEGADNSYVFSTGYAQMRPHGDSHFLLTLVQQDEFVNKVMDNCTGTSYPAINASVLASLSVRISTNIEEQARIGRYFNNFDNLITLQQQKCDKLKNIKKSLLQKMFV